jgi:hypothetical protein
MNTLLGLGIGIMILFLVMSQALASQQLTNPLTDGYTYSFNETTGTYIIDETETTLQFAGQNLIFGISVTDGIMITAIAISALIAIVGIKVLDSGLSEFSQKGIVAFAVYGGFWGIFSILTYELIIEIAIFGWFLFLIISMIYLFGIVQNIMGDK